MKYLIPISLSVICTAGGALAFAKLHSASITLPPAVREDVYFRPQTQIPPTVVPRQIAPELPQQSHSLVPAPRPLPPRVADPGAGRMTTLPPHSAPSPSQTLPAPRPAVAHHGVPPGHPAPLPPAREPVADQDPDFRTWVTGVFR